MNPVQPDDIPTHITKHIYDAPPVAGHRLSQNEAAVLLAALWPALEEHFRTQFTREQLDDPTGIYDDGAPYGTGRTGD